MQTPIHTGGIAGAVDSGHTEDRSTLTPLSPECELLSEAELVCEKCGDTYFRRISITPRGLVDNVRTRCTCYNERTEEEVQQERLAAARLVQIDVDRIFKSWDMLHDEAFQHMRFDQFQVEDPSHEQALKEISSFTPGKHEGNLVLMGLGGRGKTHLAVSLSRKIKYMGYSVLALKSIDLLNRLKKSYNRKDDNLEIVIMRLLKKVDFLLIDDIGVENGTGWVASKLYEIIDYRADRKSTIYTTNLDGDDMIKRLGQPLTSRINRKAMQIVLYGRDWRTGEAADDGWSAFGTEVDYHG